MINDPGVNAFEGAAGCGALLLQAREAAGLSRGQVAAQLRMPEQVVAALEQEQWQRLGAPVFLRGQLRSYARLLNVDLGDLLERAQMAPVQPPQLVSHVHTPRFQRMAENIGRRAVYVVITAALVVPVWYASRGHFADTPPNTASLDVVPATDKVPLAGAQSTPAAVPAARPSAAPYIASITPVARASQSEAGRTVVLDFKGDSWVDITAADGSTLERALIRAGEKRSYKPGEVARVVLGNASAVEIQQAGGTLDISSYKRANVARFTVSSDGSVAPFPN
ncbi:MAG: helix-turn-helix domain-containing protein [Stenotrophomonas sp.]